MDKFDCCYSLTLDIPKGLRYYGLRSTDLKYLGSGTLRPHYRGTWLFRVGGWRTELQDRLLTKSTDLCSAELRHCDLLGSHYGRQVPPGAEVAPHLVLWSLNGKLLDGKDQVKYDEQS